MSMSIKTRPIDSTPSAAAFGLLLLNGSLIALMLPLARIVTDAGLSPIAYAFWQTLGAGIILALLSWRHLRLRVNRNILSYCLISGATGVAFPNALAFFIVGKIGPGFTSTLYAFPPIFTLSFALLLRMEAPNMRRMMGIALACFGCFWIVWSQLGVITTATLHWYVLGLAVPVSLAMGNVYRSIAWPQGVAPVALAAGMMLGASAWLFLMIRMEGSALLPGANTGDIVGLTSLQMLLTALTYLGFFELQKRSNPVFLSQMGCIAALVGLLIGMLYFDERYALGVWLGVLVILTGLWLTNAKTVRVRKAQQKSLDGPAVGVVEG